jgi:4,5-DOPA dioxygenase extradiol
MGSRLCQLDGLSPTGKPSQDILRWKQLAPLARENHPTDEHFNPLLVVMGAASDAATPVKLHDDWRMGSLSMACWRFD